MSWDCECGSVNPDGRSCITCGSKEIVRNKNILLKLNLTSLKFFRNLLQILVDEGLDDDKIHEFLKTLGVEETYFETLKLLRKGDKHEIKINGYSYK